MIDVYHLDFESRSKAVLKKVGAYRYAIDPSTCILMCAISLNDSEPRLWVNPKFETSTLRSDPIALEWLQKLADDPTALVYAHNSPFETAVATYRMAADMGVTAPRIEQWRCTMAMARRASLPQSLEALSNCLGIEQKKDPIGDKLIKMFCIPQKDDTFLEPKDYPVEWAQFGGYCLQDVRAEQGVHKKLTAFELTGAWLEAFIADAKINARGVPVNTSALRNARVIINEAVPLLADHFRNITGFNYTQRDRILEWFRARGYPTQSMEALEVEDALDNSDLWADEQTTIALELKQKLGFAAWNKVNAMLACECGDELVRGTMLFNGAGPGRWAGKLIQPQNFKRPTIKDTDAAYKMICDGCSAEELGMLFGDPLEVLSSCIRHFIQFPRGEQMYDVDYSAVEARAVCWLAGQEDALQRFHDEIDSYVLMAEIIFGKTKDKITKDERWLGKQTVLGCGYQMWKDKFYTQAIKNAKKFKIPGAVVTPDIAERAVLAFREQYDKVVALWYACDGAARAAILNPGKAYMAGKLLKFAVVTSEGVPYLVMKLPSKRSLTYPWPKIVPDAARPGKTKIVFFGQLPMKTTWGWVSTYGGKLVENASQGVCADYMANGTVNALHDNFDIFMLVHDQGLARFDGRPIEKFIDSMTRTPAWAEGFPVKAEGKVVPYYLKT